MLLVPRQLRRYGMTGDVPYYGGRLMPAQAYAASHPSAPVPSGVTSGQDVLYGRTPTSTMPAAPPITPPRTDSEAALRSLRTSGVITQAEFDQLWVRLGQ